MAKVDRWAVFGKVVKGAISKGAGDLTGNVPSADVVGQSGRIGRDLRHAMAPFQDSKGGFFFFSEGDMSAFSGGHGGGFFWFFLAAIVILALRRSGGRRESVGGGYPGGFGGRVGRVVGVQGGQQIGCWQVQDFGSGNDGAIAQPSALAGKIDLLPGHRQALCDSCIGAAECPQRIKNRRDRRQDVIGRAGGGERIHIVDNGRSRASDDFRRVPWSPGASIGGGDR